MLSELWGFAVIDIETTGLSAAPPRVIEIGIVQLDEEFEIVEELAFSLIPIGISVQ